MSRNIANIRTLVLISILLAIIVVSLGAYTRLTHAGLGCPDWPGCYGLIDVPESSEQILKAQAAFPERLVEPAKAWNEMIHRYFAGALGLLILAIALLSLKNREVGTPIFLPILILGVVIFQAALGMWTVTMKLMPIVVMGHLLGGLTTLSLLFLLYLRLKRFHVREENRTLTKFAKFGFLGVVLLTGQIALGGWTSSNYAALVCTELPICQSGWEQQLTFEDSFDFIPPERDTYEFGHLGHDSRVTIHVMHRFGAILISIYLLWLAFSVMRRASSQFFQQTALGLVTVLFCQIGLGVSNIWFSLPLAVAVAHNVVAACLMLTLILLTYGLQRKI